MAQTLTDADVAQALQQQNNTQPNGTLNDAQVAQYLQQQQSPSAQQMAQGAASMPVGQIPVSTQGIVGLGMPTQAAVNAGSTFNLELQKAAALKNQELQQQSLANPIKAKGAAMDESAKNIVGAQTSVARDSANVNMFAGVGRQLMDYYDQAYKNGWAGDQYRAALGQKIVNGAIPKGIGLDKVADSTAPVGAFNAVGNEWMTRMTPVMQEQFGKEGGSRIMDSMLKMAAKETPGLNQPRAAVQSQLGATYKNLMRFTMGTADYKSRLGDVDINNSTPQDTVDNVTKKLWNMSSVSLKPDVERKVNDTVAYMTKDSNYQFAKNPRTGDIAIMGKGDKSWRILGQ